MKNENKRLAEMNMENVIRLVKHMMWIGVVDIFIIEAIGNLILYETHATNYMNGNAGNMLYRYLFLTTIFNFTVVILSHVVVRLLHANISRQRYIYMFAVELILMDVTFSHYEFFSVFSVLLVPIVVAALFEDRKFQIRVMIMSLLAALPGMVAKFVDERYSWSSLPEIIICYAILLGISYISSFITRYLAKRTEQMEDVLKTAESANSAKSDFLANMSHEIRTPMNAVIGMCELILREQDISPRVEEYCQDIQKSGRSLLSIINDILDFSKIESGKMELVEGNFKIASLINDVINMAVARKGDKDLEFIVHVDADIPQELCGDEQRIRQVIVNLLTNAVKYTNEGCVVVRVSHTKHNYGINLTVSVADTGIGITKENLDKLFSSFQQVDTKKNRSVEGTGLGLALVKRFVTQMGGFVNVTSEYGKGSEFRFTIPVKVADEKPFISSSDIRDVHAAGYIKWQKYGNDTTRREYGLLINELRNDLNADIRPFPTMVALKEAVKREHFTHIFTGRIEYEAEKNWFDSQAKNMEVVVMQDRMNAIEIPKDVKCMYLPFYILSVAAIFCGNDIKTNSLDGRERYANFTAPNARILLVDDNDVNLRVAAGLMRPYGMHVVMAQSARQAISILERKDIDLVFMDHMMPGMDGVEATKFIRQMPDPYYRSLPIIALSANALNGARESFIAAGMNDFIAKPMELSVLDRVLRTWLPKGLMQKLKESSADAVPQVQPVMQQAAGDMKHINLQTGILYTGGDEKTYCEILDVYVKQGSKKLSLIQEYFDSQAWKEYVIEVHALKSTSLTIGAKDLSELAKELELSGKAGNTDVIIQKNAMLLEMYGDVLSEGEKYLSENAKETVRAAKPEPANTGSTQPVQFTRDEFEELLKKIEECCDDFDTDGIEEACELAKNAVYGIVKLEPYFEEVRAAAADFEYDQAKEKAEKIRMLLGSKGGTNHV